MSGQSKSQSRIAVGISSCLLGQEVRFDGGHKRDRYVTDMLGQYFRFVPVCPELEVGMGVPREAVRLRGTPELTRMIGTKSGEDWSDRMTGYAQKRLKQRDIGELSGYILKKGSPSCGMARVKVYADNGMPSKSGAGLFARELLAGYPLRPVEEEGRMTDARLRENFIVRVFAYHNLKELFKGRLNRRAMIAFHSRYKFLLMAHSPVHYRSLGKLVAAIADYSPADFREAYGREFMVALSLHATVRKNVNVLQHIFGFLKQKLTPEEKADILRIIEDYHRELVPLIVPVTILQHYVAKFDVAYIRDQVYLNPHPKELMLRNHV